MKFACAGNLEEPFRVANHGIGKETAVRKNGERVSQSGRILGDLARLLRLFGNQAIQELERTLRIGQGGQQRRHSASRSRREAFEMTKFRARTNRVAELDLFEEIQHCS